MPGPAPKDPATRRRRNAAMPFTMLPPAGRSGPTPVWPLAKPTAKVKARWARLWASPQAYAWEIMGIDHAVIARYTLLVIKAEVELEAPLLAAVDRLETMLGVTPKAMRMLGWQVGKPDEESDEEASATIIAMADYERMVAL